MQRRWLGPALAGLVAASAIAADVPLTMRNFAVRATIRSVELRPAYGSAHASAGHQFAVLATEWENCVDPALAEKRGLAPGYGVETLAQHLYLVADGSRLGELRADLDGGAGRHSLGTFVLAKPGNKAAGDIVFELPAGKPVSLDLRYYDDIAGDMKLALAGAAPAATPLAPLAKNAVGEFGLFAFADPAPGVKAPPGFRAIALDLRGRSVWQSMKDASAYDPAIEPGTQVPRVNLLDWPELQTYLHVVADGVYSYALAPEQDLPDPIRFIPEFLTGRRLVFLVPAEARSLALVGAMPHAATDEGTLDLAPIRFPLAGKPADPAAFPGTVKIKDEMFAIAIDARRTERFADEPAGEGKVFVVLDVGVANDGKTGEFFQPAEQLLLLDGDGNEVGPDEITARGVHRPEGDKIHLPPGERRRFEVVYRLDRSVAKTRLSFHGGSFMQGYDLTPDH